MTRHGVLFVPQTVRHPGINNNKLTYWVVPKSLSYIDLRTTRPNTSTTGVEVGWEEMGRDTVTSTLGRLE